MDSPFIVLDLETTGLSPYSNKITEIAAMKIQNGKLIDTFHTLVNPQVPIPSFITRLTGITNELVSSSPKISEVLPSLKEFIEETPIVAHNAAFDLKFLAHNFMIHANHQLLNRAVCTRKLATRLLNDLPSKKLSCLCEYYNIENSQAHRALSDTQATVEVFNHFCNQLKQLGCQSTDDLIHFCHAPTTRTSKILDTWKE
jgi:DNA polymerase III subunit alpha, Gram-positive type